MRIVLLLLVFFLYFSAPSIAESDDEISEATAILTSKHRTTVRRWEYPPRIAVFHESGEAPDSQEIDRILREISLHTALDIHRPSYHAIDRKVAGEKIYELSSFEVRKNKDGVYSGLLQVGGMDSPKIESDIFVFFLSRPIVAHFMVLTTMRAGNSALPRGYLQNEGRCYFSTLALKTGIELGFIFLPPSASKERIADCLYEELFQVMGLPSDAADAEHFSFDNKPGFKADNKDHKLLKALYSLEITSGDSVQEVIDIYRQLD